MKALIDTSILVAAIIANEPFHTECDQLLDQPEMGLYTHGLTEAFSTLTSGRKSFKMRPSLASSILEEDYAPFLSFISLSPTETLRAMRDAEARGVRGGAIFDYLHLVAARKANATTLYPLNVSHFRSFHRPGDPEITP